MNVPPVIFAEAAVISTRQDYKSVLAPDADITLKNLRNYYGDPNITEQAIAKLSMDGFQVVSSSRFGISFVGNRNIFEAVFNIQLSVLESNINILLVDDSLRFNYIETSTIDEYRELLAGIVLLAPGNFLNFPEPPDKANPDQIYPHEISEKINLKAIATPSSTEKVDVAIIDSGFYAHPYLMNRQYITEENISTFIGINNGLMNFRFDLEQWKIQKKEAEQNQRYKELDIKNTIKGKLEGKDLQEYQHFVEIINRFSVSEADTFIEDHGTFMTEEDPHGHGTSIVTNFVSIFPRININLIKAFIPKERLFGESQIALGISTFLSDFRLAVSLAPKVISISLGLSYLKSIANSPVGSTSSYNLIKAEIYQAIANKIVVLMPSGNAPVQENVIDMQNNWKEPIIVGGIYYQNNIPYASPRAFGYPDDSRPVPDICAISGSGANTIWNPQPPNVKSDAIGWSAEIGTSLSTPQVAAVCAMMRTVSPALTPAQIKEILMLTCIPVPRGKTAHGASFNDIKHTLSNGRIYNPGFVNASHAILTAAYLSYALGDITPTIIDDAVNEARKDLDRIG